jgi:hypothetical protein
MCNGLAMLCAKKEGFATTHSLIEFQSLTVIGVVEVIIISLRVSSALLSFSQARDERY